MSAINGPVIVLILAIIGFTAYAIHAYLTEGQPTMYTDTDHQKNREAAARYGTDYTLEPGDRLCPGEGPDLAWADWADFVPALRAGVAVIQYVLPMYRGETLHHVEAGTWWTGGGTGAHSLTN